MKQIFYLLFTLTGFSSFAQTILSAKNEPQVTTVNGVLQGMADEDGIYSFKGIPFAQAPIGDLRWKSPQPPKRWKGIRSAHKFGPQAMQLPIFSDMIFRSNGKSEDCLYLNVWTPAKSAAEKLPVMVYFYGGGFRAGDGSEFRYDGTSMAKKGIVTLTINYRLGIFGFLAHPELTKESLNHSSGNYGFMDQHAALLWVRKNIAAFGGDPEKVTIAGESAGSMSVCAQVASPLSKGLFVGAIGESGAILGNLSPVPLADAEKIGAQFTLKAGVKSLAELRKIPGDSLLLLSASSNFPTTIDGYFLPESPESIFSKGEQMDVALLAGWNSAEVNYRSLLGKEEPTVVAYNNALHKLYGNRAEEVLQSYSVATDDHVKQVATDLASDRFIVYSTWKFLDLHAKTSSKPVYQYLFAHQLPPTVDGEVSLDSSLGARHASEIEYALGNLAFNKVYKWTPDDYKVSDVMTGYFAAFIKTGNPNGAGLPTWDKMQGSVPKVMVIDSNSHSEPEKNRSRYLLLDSFYKN